MITRRKAIQQMAMIGAGFTVPGYMPQVLSTSAEIGQKYHEDKLIRAFIATVVPGSHVNSPKITESFRDKALGFSRYRWLFTIDLRRRSRKLFRTGKFHKLTIKDREKVIRHALNRKGMIRQLYSGAIQLAQVTVYTGYFDEPEGCDLIGFKAKYTGEQTTYATQKNLFSNEVTRDGHPS